MRWTTVVLSILLLCLLVVVWVFVSPYVVLLRSVNPTHDLATTLVHVLLSAKVSNPVTQTTTWVLFALMGAACLVAWIHINLPRRTTYGSSHYAMWRETWPFSKRRPRRVKKTRRRTTPQSVSP